MPLEPEKLYHFDQRVHELFEFYRPRQLRSRSQSRGQTRDVMLRSYAQPNKVHVGSCIGLNEAWNDCHMCFRNSAPALTLLPKTTSVAELPEHT